MVKPVKTPDGQVIHLKTTYTLEDKHDVLYTSGRIIVSSDEKFMLTTCLEDVKVTDLATGRVLQTLKGVRSW
jgi:U3 small nucleolar RNA-associated protein 13